MDPVEAMRRGKPQLAAGKQRFAAGEGYDLLDDVPLHKPPRPLRANSRVPTRCFIVSSERL